MTELVSLSSNLMQSRKIQAVILARPVRAGLKAALTADDLSCLDSEDSARLRLNSDILRSRSPGREELGPDPTLQLPAFHLQPLALALGDFEPRALGRGGKNSPVCCRRRPDADAGALHKNEIPLLRCHRGLARRGIYGRDGPCHFRKGLGSQEGGKIRPGDRRECRGRRLRDPRRRLSRSGG